MKFSILILIEMCVGHPKRHPCQHTSVTYNHCVAAHFDGATRVTTPCHNTTYAAPIDTESKCTNQLCFFQELGGSWICCKCGNGPNYVGWCTFDRPRTEVNAITQQVEQLTRCDHCCCWNCTPYCESTTNPAVITQPDVTEKLKGLTHYLFSDLGPRRLKSWWVIKARWFLKAQAP